MPEQSVPHCPQLGSSVAHPMLPQHADPLQLMLQDMQLFGSEARSTQPPQHPGIVNPIVVQSVPHAPQFIRSMVVSTQFPPQQVFEHGMLHMPQLFGSVAASKHILPQQTGVVPMQTLPHMPQLFGSIVVSTQVVPHAICGAVQFVMHMPMEHISGGLIVVQSLVQPPQNMSLLSRSSHMPAQHEGFVKLIVVQSVPMVPVPPEVHPPQLLRSESAS
jgi:hypothetical protein